MVRIGLLHQYSVGYRPDCGASVPPIHSGLAVDDLDRVVTGAVMLRQHVCNPVALFPRRHGGLAFSLRHEWRERRAGTDGCNEGN